MDLHRQAARPLGEDWMGLKRPFPNRHGDGSMRRGASMSWLSWKDLRGRSLDVRQPCRGSLNGAVNMPMSNTAETCAQTPAEADDATRFPDRLDCQAAMLQAISIGRGIPMLEPWIIDEIRRREEERRRGERPQLELPVPDSSWPDGNGFDDGGAGEPSPERGVVIIGM
jgi:hypothetical protein